MENLESLNAERIPESILEKEDTLEDRLRFLRERFYPDLYNAEMLERKIEDAAAKKDYKFLNTLWSFLPDKDLKDFHLSNEDQLGVFFAESEISPSSIMAEYLLYLCGRENQTMVYAGCGSDREAWIDNLTPKTVSKLILNNITESDPLKAEQKSQQRGIKTELKIMRYAEMLKNQGGSVDTLILPMFSSSDALNQPDFEKILNEKGVIITPIDLLDEKNNLGERLDEQACVNNYRLYTKRVP